MASKTEQTVGARVATRIDGRLFTVEIYQESNGLDCVVFAGGETSVDYLGRMRLDRGAEMPVFTVARNAPSGTLRTVLAHLGLLRAMAPDQTNRRVRAREAAQYAAKRRALVSFGRVAA